MGQPRETFTTPQGTVLPLLNLKGKEYLQVQNRMIWFREEHPDWTIETEVKALTDKMAYVKAYIKDEAGKVLATSHKMETIQGFADYLEKAETGSIGRALALCGYGTQFCADELDEINPNDPENSRIVDSPVVPKSVQKTANPFQEGKEQKAALESDPGEYKITFGSKHKGKRIKDMPPTELQGFIDWLENDAAKKGQPLSAQAQNLKKAFEKFMNDDQIPA